jgi:hypothetical protein
MHDGQLRRRVGQRQMERIICLKNEFHGTSVRVRVPWTAGDDDWAEIQLRAALERVPGRWTRTLRRIEKTLCGMKDCHCGTVR